MIHLASASKKNSVHTSTVCQVSTLNTQ